jgi:hypothetical protein
MPIILQEQKTMTKLLTISEINSMLANQKFVDFGATNVIIIQDPILNKNEPWLSAGQIQISEVVPE